LDRPFARNSATDLRNCCAADCRRCAYAALMVQLGEIDCHAKGTLSVATQQFGNSKNFATA
jgi:hypothetical protein